MYMVTGSPFCHPRAYVSPNVTMILYPSYLIKASLSHSVHVHGDWITILPSSRVYFASKLCRCSPLILVVLLAVVALAALASQELAVACSMHLESSVPSQQESCSALPLLQGLRRYYAVTTYWSCPTLSSRPLPVPPVDRRAAAGSARQA